MSEFRSIRRGGVLALCLLSLLFGAVITPAGTLTTPGLTAEGTPSAFLPVVRNAQPWTECSSSRLGSILITWQEFDDSTGPELVRLAQEGYVGLAGATTYYDGLDYFPSLVGWEKAHLCNSLKCLETRISNSIRDGLEYRYLVYDPERLPGVPDGEKFNLPWATEQAQLIADEADKELLISYSTIQLHQEAEERGFGWDNPGQVVDLLAPHGDAWLIQAADEYNNPYSNPEHPDPILSQRHYPPGPEWRAAVEEWVTWIKAANPDIEIWIQLALHRIPAGPPPWEDNYPSAELVLEYREWLVNPAHGPPLVDGVYLTSTYSWPIDPVVADQEMEKAFRLACVPDVPMAAPPPSFDNHAPAPQQQEDISLVEEGWSDNLEFDGTPLPGYYYRIYENSRYPCGIEGNHQFLILDDGPDASEQKHLLAKFLGGAMGFWYYDTHGTRVYYPQENAVGLLYARLNRNWMLRNSVSQEYANGLTKRFREDGRFRILVPSYCSHDFYHGIGQCDATDGFCRYGYLAAMEAVDYVQQHFGTDKIIVYGGSAGAAGFYIGKDQDNVAGIIMDSQAVDLSAIRDACYAGHDVFGGAFPCFCPEGGPTCMEVLAPRIGFSMGMDEPYHFIERAEVSTPLYLVWNYYDASRDAHFQYDNLHNTIKQYNPGQNSIACRVCLPNADPNIGNTCIADDTYVPQANCNLHVPTAYDYDYTQLLVESIYQWALARLGDAPKHRLYLPIILK